jgi:hypothetical protein
LDLVFENDAFRAGRRPIGFAVGGIISTNSGLRGAERARRPTFFLILARDY